MRPEDPWGPIIGQRNVVAHEYGRIDHRQLHRTATEDLPRLLERLRAMLPSFPEDGGDELPST